MPLIDAPEVSYFLGLDLGQSNDRSALCVLERTLTKAERSKVDFSCDPLARYDVRHLERPELGTPYPKIVERVSRVCEKLAASAPGAKGELVVDATGVGKPVVDLLRAARLPFPVCAVSITGGDRVNSDSLSLRVPKRDLVASLVVMFQTGTLRIAERLADAQALVHELVNFRVKVSAAGHDSYGNNREGQHDDLVLGCALAAWRAQYRRPRVLGGIRPLYHW